MIWKIAKKELLLNLTTFMFTVGIPNLKSFRKGVRSELFRQKTLTLKNKNKIFHFFYLLFSTSSYENPASKIETFFGSNLYTPLIIEELPFPFSHNMKYEI